MPVGLNHTDHGSPRALPTSTRPDAMPPSVAPNQKGTSTEAKAKVAPSVRASRMVPACPRSAKAVPRKMIPSAARNMGT